MPEAAGSSPALSLSLLHGEKNKFGKEFTMEKRPLDTELEVLWSEHLEDDVFSVALTMFWRIVSVFAR